ncbi:uncharacterized protein LOC117508747 [Thalassophryne amazonica]|uniref:uncharacterized protein LOC117508747 n=1 Tax=Thalassophryne amazonica TaxID=390379 RepID=UPI0014715290|nr:uncharacterized protein LOC117508747 [Thalassophryne amazonica]
MDGPRTSLCLLLLSQLSVCPTDTDQDLSTAHTHYYTTKNLSSGPTPGMEPDMTTDLTQSDDVSNNTSGADCLIDTQMGLIALASAGGLIICLLVTTVVLACQVCYIQRQVRAPRPSRSNMDLVSGTGYWGTDQPEVVGLVGPCDSSVMLEEVRTDSEMERQGEKMQAEKEDGAEREAGKATAVEFDLEDRGVQMQSSTSRDSCLEVPRDVENMPLVV